MSQQRKMVVTDEVVLVDPERLMHDIQNAHREEAMVGAFTVFFNGGPWDGRTSVWPARYAYDTDVIHAPVAPVDIFGGPTKVAYKWNGCRTIPGFARVYEVVEEEERRRPSDHIPPITSVKPSHSEMRGSRPTAVWADEISKAYRAAGIEVRREATQR